MAGGDAAIVEAPATTTVGEFKRLVIKTLRTDDDEPTRRVTVVDLLLDEKPLLEDSATIAESGLSDDKAVLAIFKQRCVECVRWQDVREDLSVDYRPAVLIIPDGTTELPSRAFKQCTSIQSVRIPVSLTSIGASAFSYCSSLTSLTIPDSVTSIGEGAFCRCRSLTSLTIPDSVTSIGEEAFYYCSSLTSLKITSLVISVGDNAFGGCSSLTHLVIPRSLSLETFPHRLEACEVEWI